jgi:hypothetical protein
MSDLKGATAAVDTPSPGTSADMDIGHGAHRRARRIKKSDPFLDLPDDAANPPFPAGTSDRNNDSHHRGGAGSPSLFSDVCSRSHLACLRASLVLTPLPICTPQLILTPISMISFLISLFVVDHQERHWRLSQHASNQTSFWARLSNWSWLDPEPYQEPNSTAWKAKETTAAQVGRVDSFHGWYRRKLKRATAKMEFNDAFEMRGRVMVALVAWAVFGVALIVYSGRWIYGWLVS